MFSLVSLSVGQVDSECSWAKKDSARVLLSMEHPKRNEFRETTIYTATRDPPTTSAYSALFVVCFVIATLNFVKMPTVCVTTPDVTVIIAIPGFACDPWQNCEHIKAPGGEFREKRTADNLGRGAESVV